MMAALLDTNAVSDLMRDDQQVMARVASYPDPIVTSVVVIGEIRHGLSRLPAGKKHTELEARAQTVLANVAIEPIADAYGQLKASLEAQGLNFNDNDLWIAATALTIGSVLVTRDQAVVPATTFGSRHADRRLKPAATVGCDNPV